ncbi:MAG: type II secretion system protein, partial [Pedosphaera parvula]|nr:type II secretion system protein [Pedosphaera parvula]
MKHRIRLPKGFTLIELMVVITIISILAALIVPALQRAQATAMAANCMARAKAIAATIASYAPSWDGWTNPDRDAFVKELGYKLNTEQGYYGEAAGWYDPNTNPPNQSELYASRIKDVRCPTDPKPNINRHGIPQSYVVTSTFAGGNIMSHIGAVSPPKPSVQPASLSGGSIVQVGMTADQILAVKEAGKRHPSGRTLGGVETIEGHYVFADLHATLGYAGPSIPGLKARAWHQGGPGNIKGVAESKLKTPDYETVWTTQMGGDGKWLYVLNQLPAGGSDWNISHSDSQGWNWGGWGQRWPLTFCWRWDGVCKFPKTGVYEFGIHQDRYGHESGELGIGVMGQGANDPTSFTVLGPPGNGQAFVYNKNIGDVSDSYPMQFLFWSGSDWHGNWNFHWRLQDGAGGYDSLLGGTGGQVM